MGKNITVTLGYDDGSGVWQPHASKKLYLKPSRNDIFVLRGAVWVPWEGHPDNDVGYKDAIQVTTNLSGVATFTDVPYTDSEIQLPLDSAGAEQVPAPVWLIIDPNAQGGTKVYYGPLPSSLGAAAVTPKDLITLPSPNTWQIQGTVFNLYPQGNEQMGDVTLAPGAEEAVVNFNPPFTVIPRIFFGTRADKSGAVIVPGIKQDASGVKQLTVNSGTIKASAKPLSSVTFWVLARG